MFHHCRIREWMQARCAGAKGKKRDRQCTIPTQNKGKRGCSPALGTVQSEGCAQQMLQSYENLTVFTPPPERKIQQEEGGLKKGGKLKEQALLSGGTFVGDAVMSFKSYGPGVRGVLKTVRNVHRIVRGTHTEW